MAKEKKQPAFKSKSELFTRDNYILMLAGLVLLALGFIFMNGGKSPDPKVFNSGEIYSTARITLAPALIILGFIVEIFAIMKKPRKKEDTTA